MVGQGSMAYRHAGFTLIEMVMMLILIGILAVVFVPRAPSKGSLTIAGQAQQLASDLRYVQALSMTRMTAAARGTALSCPPPATVW